MDSAYISRVFPLSPIEAIDAVECWHRRLADTARRGRLVAGQRLFLRPSFEPTDFDPLLLRRLRGTLWVGWWWPVRIELELATYSRCASEVALRPSTVRWPVAIERYGKDATEAVDEVVAAVMISMNAEAELIERSEASVRCARRVQSVGFHRSPRTHRRTTTPLRSND